MKPTIILVQEHWKIELVTESQLGEVQMKPPLVTRIKIFFKYFLDENFQKQGHSAVQGTGTSISE
jgi:hypothetical protein